MNKTSIYGLSFADLIAIETRLRETHKTGCEAVGMSDKRVVKVAERLTEISQLINDKMGREQYCQWHKK